MRAFIVRPFGKKNGVDFEKVHKKLILPALKKARIKGHTTEVIAEAGNIRQDMFQLLLTADLVIADISIHNANVFYELGIRHALREASTILIRSRQDEVPFDLKTDRYLAYVPTDLASGIDPLYESIRATMVQRKVDSPVFMMLPKLKAQNPEEFLAIPSDFFRELEIARGANNQGKLGLLAYEAGHFPWAIPALRAIAEIQYATCNYEGARETWERIKKVNPNDLQANERLATIYHRLGEQQMVLNPDLGNQLLAKSEEAITFLFSKSSELDSQGIAEAYALKARNEKSKWLARWTSEEPAKATVAAIRSNLLKSAYTNYANGYYEDLNHFYSGVNALGMLKVMLELADRETELWNAKFESTIDAKKALSDYKKEFSDLAIVVRKAIFSKIKKLEREDRQNAWVAITRADLALLTGASPQRVRNLYAEALEAGGRLKFDAAKRQLLIYQRLNIAPENVTVALAEFGSDNKSDTPDEEAHVILFTGHMIDRADRAKPRFPKEKEAKVKKKIKSKLMQTVAQLPGNATLVEKARKFTAIAGGACGGDILFHESCKELGIISKMYLALPREAFIGQSVRFAGNEWVDRFNALIQDEGNHFVVMSDKKELPNWLKTNNFGYSFWERNNLWMLHAALALGRKNLTFLALWNGKQGDGPGGTKHLLEEVEKRGAKSIVLKPK